MVRILSQQRTLARIFSSLCLAAATSMLVACGTPVMKPEQASSIKRVGVISVLPSELSYQKIGITVFNNEYAKRPVGDAFNQAARSAAESVLTQKGREVIQIEVDVPTIAKRLRSGAIIFDSSAERIEDVLLPLIKQHRLDAVLLVNEMFDSENGINGVRIFLRAGLNNIRGALAQPHVGTILVDTRVKLLASQGEVGSFAQDRANGHPWVYRLEDNLDPATQERVAAAMRNTIRSSVAYQVQSLGF
jgi:hypothetical protein